MGLDSENAASAALAPPPPECGGPGAAAVSPDVGMIAAIPMSESAHDEVLAAMREAEELVAQAVQNIAATLHRR